MSDVQTPPEGDEDRGAMPPAAMRAEMRGITETRVSPRSEFELREVPNGAGGTNLRFTGFACVTDAEYEMEDFIGPWIESVSVGSFRKTLNDGADVAFLLNHAGMTLARTKPGTLKLSEQTDRGASPIPGITGLHSEALFDPANMYVQAMRSAVERGDLDEMSFAFRVIRQEWNEAWDRRWINEVSLDKGDVSLVNYAASPATGGTVALRQRLFGRGETMERERLLGRLLVARGVTTRAYLDSLIEVRAGKTLSQASLDVLQPILDDLAAIDKMVDVDQPKLAELLGVANPDDDDADGDADEEQESAAEPDEGRAASTYLLPDHTTRARLDLAEMRRR